MEKKETGSSQSRKRSLDEKYQEMIDDEIFNEIIPKRNTTKGQESSIEADDAIQTEERPVATDSLQTTEVSAKRISTKQRKESLEEYRQAFLQIPKLEDRKPVFISREVRDHLDEIVRKLGGRRMSVSGFIENLARHHLELYREDMESWKKM
jgi:Protein of unknown function (DUF3408).